MAIDENSKAFRAENDAMRAKNAHQMADLKEEWAKQVQFT